MATSRKQHVSRSFPALAFVLLVASADASAQPRVHLSTDLQQQLDAGNGSASTVIVSGTAAQVDAIAARHGLRVRRRLDGGAVLDVPAGRLTEVAGDAAVTQLTSDHEIRGQMGVGDVSTGAEQAWAGDFGVRGTGVTGRGVGVAILDSGVTIVPELRGQVYARVDMMTPGGSGSDEWGHGTHLAGIIAGAGSIESSGRGIA